MCKKKYIYKKIGSHEEKETSKSGTDDGNTPGQSTYKSWSQMAFEDQER